MTLIKSFTRFTTANGRLLRAAILIFGAFAFAATSRADSPDALEVRIGILAYEDFHRDLQDYDRLFAELAKEYPEISFHIASGTYGDLMHWLKHGSIDVAIVTPAVFAEAIRTNDTNAPRYERLAALRMPPVFSELAMEDRRQPTHHDYYHSACVAAADSPLKSLDDVIIAMKSGRAELLFVDPLSISGCVAPKHALSEAGIKLHDIQIRFTYSHTQSLRLLLDKSTPKLRIAFVWDGAADDLPEAAGKLRRIPIPELDTAKFSTDLVIARTGFEQTELIRSELLAKHPDLFQPVAPDAAATNSAASLLRVSHRDEISDTQNVSLEQIGSMLLQYARSHPQPPRLAVVLSGGGAKCSYQVGAIAAIEEELARRRQQPDGDQLDIRLVVGTSGGAINALPIALGVSATPNGRTDFEQVWKQLDQREIVKPASIVRANIGLWFAILWLAGVYGWTGRKYPESIRRAEIESRIFVIVGLIELAIGYLPYRPWSLLGHNHAIHHAWLWCTLGVRWSAWFLLTIGLAGIVLRGKWPAIADRIRLPRKTILLGCAAALLVLPIGQLVTVLFFQQTLSGGDGIEHALAHGFSGLIESNLKSRKKPPLERSKDVNEAEDLREISRQIVDRRLLSRDLVLTGSCLAQSAEQLPSDLYFFAPANSSTPPPPFEDRGISLVKYPEILLDVVMGSGSIYPMFPPRTIRDFPQPGQTIDLVDGGFAHNSPIEAAVLWDATHIVLIQASPEERIERHNFVQNASAAFNHLYAQAQLLDSRSKDQVTIFTLAPTSPHLCVLDFADNLIADTIAKGYREAGGHTGEIDSISARFRKELGEPIFWPAGKLQAANQ